MAIYQEDFFQTVINVSWPARYYVLVAAFASNFSNADPTEQPKWPKIAFSGPGFSAGGQVIDLNSEATIEGASPGSFPVVRRSNWLIAVPKTKIPFTVTVTQPPIFQSSSVVTFAGFHPKKAFKKIADAEAGFAESVKSGSNKPAQPMVTTFNSFSAVSGTLIKIGEVVVS